MRSQFILPSFPARIAQLIRALDLKTRRCGFDFRVGQHNNYYCYFDQCRLHKSLVFVKQSPIRSEGSCSPFVLREKKISQYRRL